MSSRTASVFLLAALLTAPLMLSAQPPASHAEETELGGKMDAMSGAFRKLRRQVADVSKNAESLKLVAEMKAAALESAKLIPARAAEVAEDERAKFVAAYRDKMAAFSAKLDELEAALKADKNDDAGKIVAALGAMQKEGHKDFKKPDKH